MVALALGLGACKPDQSATGDAAREAMSLYAKGYNVLLGQPADTLAAYFSTIPEAGPQPGAKPYLHTRASWAQKAVTEAREAFTAAAKAAPSALAALAPAAEQVIARHDAALAVIADAERYYEAETYKDDQLARGKALHAQLVAARRELGAAMRALEDGLSQIEDAQAAAEVKARAGDPDYGYWFRAFNLEAKRYLAAMRRDADAAHQAAATTALRAAHDALAAFVAGKGSGLASGFSTYVGAADTFWAASQKLVRQRQGTPSETGDAERGLVTAYNGLIQTGNFLYELEASHALK